MRRTEDKVPMTTPSFKPTKTIYIMAIIKKLKWGVYSTLSGKSEVEMNVIENRSDLNKFVKETNSILMKDIWTKYLKDKSIILVHSNGVSWCTENTTGDIHPSCFNRVNLGELIK